MTRPTPSGTLLSPDVQSTVRRRYERQIAAGQDRSPEHLAAQAALVALDGSPALGRTMLRDVAAAHRPSSTGEHEPAYALVLAALVCGDMELASGVLGAEHGPDVSVRVSVMERAHHGAPAGIVDCLIVPPRTLAFELPAALFSFHGFLSLVNRWLQCIPLFVRSAARPRVRAGRIMLQLTDGPRAAGLGFCARSKNVTLIPDPDFLRSHGYRPMRQHMQEHGLAWASRRPVALWRGSPNGFPERGQGWRSLPRVKLCVATRAHNPDLFDTGITAPLPPHHPDHDALADSDLMSAPIPSHDFQAYRYQIDIDGYTNAWSGLFLKLLTGSAVLKIGSAGGWRQWYYDLLKPWTHFVPVAADLGDLAEKTRWLVAHDDRAERIGAAGRALAESLTYERQLDWAAQVILRAL